MSTPPKPVAPGPDTRDIRDVRPPAPDPDLPAGDVPSEPEQRTRVNKTVFIGSAVGVLGIALWAIIDRESADAVIGSAVAWVGSTFGWWYSLIVVSVLVFVLFVAVSRVGKTRLGPDHSRPTFNLFTWTAMLFAAGIGIDLMFFSVAEPVTQYLAPPTGDGSTVESARQAVVWTLFHYGILGWGLYALMGMALGYFAFRHNLPLSIRSALYPILGKRIHGPVGHAVDIAAMLGTIFGIATSLGIGVAQLNFGLSFQFGIPENTVVQIALIAVAVVMATISVLTGIEKGIRRLSELNVILAISLMVFVLITGSTRFLLDGIVTNIGDTLARFPSMALDTFAYDRPDDWLNGWTLFFWAWWIAWAPFVGLFLARISRGTHAARIRGRRAGGAVRVHPAVDLDLRQQRPRDRDGRQRRLRRGGHEPARTRLLRPAGAVPDGPAQRRHRHLHRPAVLRHQRRFGCPGDEQLHLLPQGRRLRRAQVAARVLVRRHRRC